MGYLPPFTYSLICSISRPSLLGTSIALPITSECFELNISTMYQGTRTGVPRSRTCTTMVLIGRFKKGFLGIITHKHPRAIGIYRAYIEISHRGTLVGVHPTIWQKESQKIYCLVKFWHFLTLIFDHVFWNYEGYSHQNQPIACKGAFFLVYIWTNLHALYNKIYYAVLILYQ